MVSPPWTTAAARAHVGKRGTSRPLASRAPTRTAWTKTNGETEELLWSSRAGGDDGAEEEENADDGPLDSTALRARWDSEVATVRLLEREGMHASHPALRAAVAARDAAEQAYKKGKAPHPVARRLGWAQARLDKARKSRDKTRAELAAFDEECLARRQRFLDKLEEDNARVSKHGEALEELQMEAGAEVFSPARGSDGGKEACEKAAGSLREAAPRAAAIAESLPEGSITRQE